MKLYQREITIPAKKVNSFLFTQLCSEITARLLPEEVPIRFAITETTEQAYRIDVGVLNNSGSKQFSSWNNPAIFTFLPRTYEITSKFTTVLLIPTGIGAELGGHAGDAGAVARLFASSCDKLITHPNVVNASDINELPENGLYVEGSVISELMMGTLGLQETRANRIMLIIEAREDRRITDISVNTVSAARASIGIDCIGVVELQQLLKMESRYSQSGCAVGHIEQLDPLLNVLYQYRDRYDAIALQTGIDVSAELRDGYLQSRGEIINPWGGVEAMLTHLLALTFGVPVAHAPMVKDMDHARPHIGIVDPRMSAEIISSSYLLCVLKGLHKSPHIIRDTGVFGKNGIITNSDISCLVIPDGCVGIPTLAAMEQGIPVIAVRENRNQMRNNLEDYPFKPGKLFIVDNYLEAVGVMNALKAGVSIESVRRPLSDTRFF
jgi:hypothetical protein